MADVTPCASGIDLSACSGIWPKLYDLSIEFCSMSEHPTFLSIVLMSFLGVQGGKSTHQDINITPWFPGIPSNGPFSSGGEVGKYPWEAGDPLFPEVA